MEKLRKSSIDYYIQTRGNIEYTIAGSDAVFKESTSIGVLRDKFFERDWETRETFQARVTADIEKLRAEPSVTVCENGQWLSDNAREYYWPLIAGHMQAVHRPVVSAADITVVSAVLYTNAYHTCKGW